MPIRNNRFKFRNMRLNKLFILYSLLGILIASCIQDEAPNAEADIETCTVVFPDNIINDIQIGNKQITLYVKPDADVSQVKLDFTLTPGATVEPASGTVRDFTTPKIYTVTSEDRKWKKNYIVTATTSLSSIPTKYDFEHFEKTDGKYYTFYEQSSNGIKQDIWASGNGAFAIAAFGKGAEEYPTIPYDRGRTGKCVKLETKSTGFGALVKMPIAAGNLFIGKFDNSAIVVGNQEASLKATLFGLNFDFVPKALTGYYKYKAGEKFTEGNGSTNPDAKDTFDIYAIVYETDDDTPYLDGTCQLTSPRLISVARIKEEDRKETDEWTAFYIPFEVQPGKTFDKTKLTNGKYKISVVFSSSINGDRFRGAVGSTLFIDDVEIITED